MLSLSVLYRTEEIEHQSRELEKNTSGPNYRSSVFICNNFIMCPLISPLGYCPEGIFGLELSSSNTSIKSENCMSMRGPVRLLDVRGPPSDTWC